jgi:nitrogen regulatory protein PII 2
MKEVFAVVRMNMMNITKRALSEAGIYSMSAREALGRGKGIVDIELLRGAERGYEEAISQLGQSSRLIPKRALMITVPDELVEKTVMAIMRTNHTGKSGDGVIWVTPVVDAIRVRTGECGDEVLDGA